MAKCLTAVVAEDLEDVFGSEQLAGGLEGGIEASIHVTINLLRVIF